MVGLLHLTLAPVGTRRKFFLKKIYVLQQHYSLVELCAMPTYFGKVLHAKLKRDSPLVQWDSLYGTNLIIIHKHRFIT